MTREARTGLACLGVVIAWAAIVWGFTLLGVVSQPSQFWPNPKKR